MSEQQQNPLERLKSLQAAAGANEDVPSANEPIRGPEVVEEPVQSFPLENRKFVIIKRDAVNASEVGQQQADIISRHAGRMRMAVIQYAAYLSEDIINSPGNVATGPEFPYHFAWIANDPQRMSRASSRGYRAVKVTDPKFVDTLIIGEDALSMFIDRSPRMQRYYAQQKVKMPGKLPERLSDKWGFFIPPFVDEKTHHLIWEGKELWYCEREIVEDRQRQMREVNRNKNPNQTNGNFLADEVGGGIVDRFNIDVDNPTTI